MKRNVFLYIDGVKADLGEDTLVLFNYEREEQGNPTVVKNSYSQQVTLPATPTNNGIFQFHRPDRVTGSGFDPIARTPFQIFSEAGEIVESGYVKLEEVKRTPAGVASYRCTLYGGLGGFFYSLMYNDDGTKKTLADLSIDGDWIGDGSTGESSMSDYSLITMSMGGDMMNAVYEAWRYLAEDSTYFPFGYETDYWFYGFINFAPAYNGLPECKFGADKAIYAVGDTTLTTWNGIYTGATVSGVQYTPRYNDGVILLEMEEDHTEWQMQDLRWYLQRPVVNIYRLLTLIASEYNTGEYTLVLDSGFFNTSNYYLKYGWMTLPMVDRDNIDDFLGDFADFFAGTASPAEYLIGFAKTFGLVFDYDAPTKTVTLMRRNEYYSGGDEHDISSRICGDITIKPTLMDAKHYIWQTSESVGEFVEEYEKKYGRVYGSQWVNTGYDFDADQKEVLDTVYRGAADARETDGWFQSFPASVDSSTGEVYQYYFKFSVGSKVTWKLWNTSGNVTSQDFEITVIPTWDAFSYNLGQSYMDFTDRLQLHGADNSAEDGDNVLCFFKYMEDLPAAYDSSDNVLYRTEFHLSTDTDTMLALNDGEPCWNVCLDGDSVMSLDQLPCFTRYAYNLLLEMGDPLEVAVQATDAPASNKNIYTYYWKDYIEDRFDKDTKVVTCKVDFTGMNVTQSLLRDFWWFDNCWWVLNKIKNYSMTTFDPVECEFVQVQDKDNYTNGQS